uniref:protein-glutamine gamma-glutamyltransferase K-like isoform X1 n=1 Tax=Styela clava TaxID=7725 RepID=UPI00193AA13B|nr:protein-glutamine gamma-glutamyltransferase K-like isoform X1 [Styela clava]
MSSQSDRTEYVTTDSGCKYSGNESSLIPIPCVFGQHEMGVLEACIELLDSCNLPTAKKGDPVSVTRAICRRIANITNTTPTKMTQSHYGGVFDTLRNFMKIGMLDIPDNLNSTAILVTVFRCLGLPSRSVTGINCAVETDLPMTVNVHYNDEGYSLDYLNNDKIWPSVSWVGVWMSRVDLPPGFGGWQEIMPWHSSLGPVPVYAIKKGQTYCCEGTQEHFFTLNADTKHWVVSKDGNMALMKIQQRAAGLSIFTKAVGSMEPQDITKLYKFSEGCEEQKLAIHTAYMHCGRQNVIDESEMKNGDTKITLSTNPPVINFGNDVDVITKITNSSDFVRHLTVNLCGTVVAEDGTPIMKLQKETILAEVLANESVDIPVKFNLGPYLHKLSPNCHLLFTAFGKIRELEEQYNIATHYVGIKYPEIEIQIHGEFKVAGELTIVSRIRNPLPNLLLNSKLILTTSGLTPLHIVTNSGKSVGPWQVFKTERLYRCQRPGKHTIVASFTSDRMTGLMGIQDINIAC